MTKEEKAIRLEELVLSKDERNNLYMEELTNDEEYNLWQKDRYDEAMEQMIKDHEELRKR